MESLSFFTFFVIVFPLRAGSPDLRTMILFLIFTQSFSVHPILLFGHCFFFSRHPQTRSLAVLTKDRAKAHTSKVLPRIFITHLNRPIDYSHKPRELHYSGNYFYNTTISWFCNKNIPCTKSYNMLYCDVVIKFIILFYHKEGCTLF